MTDEPGGNRQDLFGYGLEKSLERHLPEQERRWLVAEAPAEYGEPQEFLSPGWPSNPEP